MGGDFVTSRGGGGRLRRRRSRARAACVVVALTAAEPPRRRDRAGPGDRGRARSAAARPARVADGHRAPAGVARLLGSRPTRSRDGARRGGGRAGRAHQGRGAVAAGGVRGDLGAVRAPRRLRDGRGARGCWRARTSGAIMVRPGMGWGRSGGSCSRLDGTPSTARALEPAGDLARRAGAALNLVLIADVEAPPAAQPGAMASAAVTSISRSTSGPRSRTSSEEPPSLRCNRALPGRQCRRASSSARGSPAAANPALRRGARQRPPRARPGTAAAKGEAGCVFRETCSAARVRPVLVLRR